MQSLMFVHALSSLHAGVGQGVGLIDLPIARERATGIPYLPGSSLKGSLRDIARQSTLSMEEQNLIFGPPTSNADAHAGTVQFADQRLLLLPVRSLRGTFAWVTSPFILHRLTRDAANIGLSQLPALPQLELTAANAEPALTANGSALVMAGQKVILEELDLSAQVSAAAAEWAAWIGQRIFPAGLVDSEYWQATLRQRICIVRDDVLLFLLSTATEVVARIRLEEDRKTVAKGALWYEESLPAETVLVGMVNSTPVRVNGRHLTDDTITQHLQNLSKQPLQLGGKSTVGRGLCRLSLAGNGAAQ